MLNVQKNCKKIFNLFALFLLFLVNQPYSFAADTTSCYVLIEGKVGCSGLTTISDITHTGQLKCFTIDKKAKDCGVFVNVLPFDTDQGLITGIESIDCTGVNKNSEQCADYCYNNPDASSSECVDCDSLTEAEKEAYPYCGSTWCPFESDDNNGSSWPKTLAGVVNVTGTCLDGYSGTATRNCLSGGIWGMLDTQCSSAKCAVIDETVGATYTNGYAAWPETDAGINNIEGSCIQDYEQASVGINPTRNCNSNGQWQEVINACIPAACQNSTLNANDEVPNAIFTNTTGITEVGETQEATTCETGYTMAGIVIATCQNDRTWVYSNTALANSEFYTVTDSCGIKTCETVNINQTSYTLLNSSYTDSIIKCSDINCSSTVGTQIPLNTNQIVQYGEVFKVYSCDSGYSLVDGTTDRIIMCTGGNYGVGEWTLISSSSSSKYCHAQCTSSSPVISSNDITFFDQAGYIQSHCVSYSPSTCGIFQGYYQATGLSFGVTTMSYANFDVDYGSSVGAGVSGNYSYMVCKQDTNENMYFEYAQQCCLFSNLMNTVGGTINIYSWSAGTTNSTTQNALCSNHYYVQGTCSNYNSGGTIAAKCGSDGNWNYAGNMCNTECDNAGVSSIAANVTFPGFVSTGTTEFNTILTGTCISGYELTGADAGITEIQVTCNNDTTWASNLSGTGCTAIQCQNDDVESMYATLFGLTTGGTTSYPTSYTQYECPNGYEFANGGWEITLQCQADGTWAFGGSECVEPVVCQNGDLTNFVSNDIDVWGTTLHDECVDGFASDQITPRAALCSSTGTWSYVENSSCAALMVCNNNDLSDYNILDDGFSYSGTTDNGDCVTGLMEGSDYSIFVAFTCNGESWNSNENTTCPGFEPDYSGDDCQNSFLLENSYWSYNVLPSGFSSSGTTSSGTCIDTTYEGTPESATCYNGNWMSGWRYDCAGNYYG
ncbi:MAG: hypothetical protein PHY80_04595 [Rickettsiales bacterium]|nr:hypothetical protein [Rickettsiales bacterium]